VVLPVGRPCWQYWEFPNSSVQKAYCRQSHMCGHFEAPISNVTLLLPEKSKIQIISKYINIILHTRITFLRFNLENRTPTYTYILSLNAQTGYLRCDHKTRSQVSQNIATTLSLTILLLPLYVHFISVFFLLY